MARPRLSSPDQPAGVRFLLGFYEGLASLKLAMVLILAAAVVLGAATFVEKFFGAEAARTAVYGTTWFAGLNAFLFLNVLSAMLIRFPWKRRQAGFVVVHAGILVLLAGCLLTRLGGIEAELPVYEQGSAQTAYLPSRHFELEVDRGVPTREVTDVAFKPGPFNWSEYARSDLRWYLWPWRLTRRDNGVLYDSEGIRLEVLDYRRSAHPLKLGEPGREAVPERALVRLSVDGRSEQSWIQGIAPAANDQPPGTAERKVVQGSRRRVSVTLRHDNFDLGFEVRLHQFDRRLDPGSETVAHYSSLLDIASPDPPEERLAENVVVTLNEPASVSDPTSGRCYRLYQASYFGPFSPGEPGYPRGRRDKTARKELFVSVLTVNYDPGRPLKYAGTLVMVAGFLMVYSMRGRGRKPEVMNDK